MSRRIRQFLQALAVFAAISGVANWANAGFTINFDTDAAGNPYTAPDSFDKTTPLTEFYAPLGVHFSGPATDQGGSILNDSTFTVKALSGFNFLAFNRAEGISLDPETIHFDAAQREVSVSAAAAATGGGFFTLTAYDANNTLLGTATISTDLGNYGLLDFTASGNLISRVVLTESGASAFVYDNLTVSTSTSSVPEPNSLALTGIAGLVSLGSWFGRRIWIARS